MARDYLIVDDSPVVRNTLERMLTELGREDEWVYTAESSEEALDVFHEVEPDVVFMDIKLPDVDGEQTASVMLTQDPKTLVIVISALSADDKRVRNLLAVGAFEFLGKPIHSEDIKAVIQRVDEEKARTEGTE